MNIAWIQWLREPVGGAGRYCGAHHSETGDWLAALDDFRNYLISAA